MAVTQNNPIKKKGKFRFNIQMKMILMGLGVVVIFIGMILGFILPNTENALYKEKQTQIKQNVDIVYNVIEYYYTQQTLGRMTLDEAQKGALSTIKQMRYGEEGADYFWVNDFTPTMIMHPIKPEMDNQDLNDYLDASGKLMFVEFVDICKASGAGYTNYYWQYGTDANRIEPKLSYVKSFEPWGWIVGTGIYTVDIDETIGASTLQAILFSLGIAIVCVVLILVISGMISKNIKRVVKVADKLALGETDMKLTSFSGDETGDLGRSMNQVVDYLEDMSTTAEKIANGDLTMKVKPKSNNDTLSKAFSTMITKLNVLIKQVADNAKSLASAGSQLNTASQEAGQASQQIATSSQQVAKGAAEQADSLGQATQGMHLLSKAIDQITSGSQDQSNSIERNVEIVNKVSEAINLTSENAFEADKGAKLAAEYAEKGAKITEETVAGMKSIKNTMSIASEKVNDLGNQSKEIGKIIATIGDISDQTNLLALNAAIEAARAGEQGRGFAVVADEVRKLAERSSSSTKEIAELIKNIQAMVNDTIEAISAGNEEVEKGYELASNAGNSLQDILQQASSLGKQVEMITGAATELRQLSDEMVQITDSLSAVVEENTASTEEMAASSKQVVQSVEGIAGVSEENSAASEQVSASSEQITAQVQQVVASAQELSRMASELETAVSYFRTNGHTDDQDALNETSLYEASVVQSKV
jgi:methyl-accepting chemotaxis protein